MPALSLTLGGTLTGPAGKDGTGGPASSLILIDELGGQWTVGVDSGGHLTTTPYYPGTLLDSIITEDGLYYFVTEDSNYYIAQEG